MQEVIVSTLPELARTINRAQQNVDSLLTEALGHALEAGNALIHAKALVDHGQWQNWLEGNCVVSDRTARSYMRLARELPKLSSEERQRVAVLPLREAITALATPRSDSSADIDGQYLVAAPSHLTPDKGLFAITFNEGRFLGETFIWQDSRYDEPYFNIATWHWLDNDSESEFATAGFHEYTAKPINSCGIIPYLEHHKISTVALDWCMSTGEHPIAHSLQEDAERKYRKNNPWLEGAA